MEVGKGLLRRLPDGVFQAHEGQRAGVGDAAPLWAGQASGEEQDAAAVGHGLFGQGAVGDVTGGPQNKLRGTQDVAVLPAVCHGAVFRLRRKAQDLDGLAMVLPLEGRLQGLHGLVVRGHVGDKIG